MKKYAKYVFNNRNANENNKNKNKEKDHGQNTVTEAAQKRYFQKWKWIGYVVD